MWRAATGASHGLGVLLSGPLFSLLHTLSASLACLPHPLPLAVSPGGGGTAKAAHFLPVCMSLIGAEVLIRLHVTCLSGLLQCAVCCLSSSCGSVLQKGPLSSLGGLGRRGSEGQRASLTAGPGADVPGLAAPWPLFPFIALSRHGHVSRVRVEPTDVSSTSHPLAGPLSLYFPCGSWLPCLCVALWSVVSRGGPLGQLEARPRA